MYIFFVMVGWYLPADRSVPPTCPAAQHSITMMSCNILTKYSCYVILWHKDGVISVLSGFLTFSFCTKTSPSLLFIYFYFFTVNLIKSSNPRCLLCEKHCSALSWQCINSTAQHDTTARVPGLVQEAEAS